MLLNSPIFYNVLFPLAEIWYSKIMQPGIKISRNSIWQVQEGETLKEDEYDLIIKYGFDYMQNTVLKRALGNRYGDYLNYKAHELENNNIAQSYIYENGFPVLTNLYSHFTTPMDLLVGARSAKYFFYDCYTKPDKIKDVMDAIWVGYKDYVKNIIHINRNNPDIIGVLIGGWRSAPSMINEKLFERFVWPYMFELGNILIENDLVSVFHLDLNWDKEMYRFRDFPERKIIINTDGNSNMPRMRKILGENFCFLGDVLSTMMSYSSTEEITQYVHKLMDNVGTKGLIVSAGCAPGIETTAEKYIALFNAVYSWK